MSGRTFVGAVESCTGVNCAVHNPIGEPMPITFDDAARINVEVSVDDAGIVLAALPCCLRYDQAIRLADLLTMAAAAHARGGRFA